MFNRNLRLFCATLKANNCSVVLSRNINVDFKNNREIINFYMNNFDIPEYRVYSMMLKYPSLQRSDVGQLDNSLKTILNVGIQKEKILEHPRLLNVHSKTIRNKWTVLNECKLNRITVNELCHFKSIFRIYSISNLHKRRLLMADRDIWSDLVECFSYWPDVQHALLTQRMHIDPDNQTLFEIRMEILKRFLKSHLNYSTYNFDHIVNLYAPIRNRAFTTMCQVIHLLEEMQFPKSRILSYGYTLLLDPENIINIREQIKELGGIKVETVLQKYPTIMKNDYKDLLEIKRMLKEAEISDEIQQKCLLLYTLCSDTVEERLQEVKSRPEFQGFESHPRIMSFLYNRTKVGLRMDQLKFVNKKCFSLHKLVGGQKEFDCYINNFGDQTRSVDILHFLCEKFAPEYSREMLKDKLTVNQMNMGVSTLNVIEGYNYLEKYFNKADMFENCQLLLYSLQDVQNIIEFFLHIRSGDVDNLAEYSSILKMDLNSVDVTHITDSQILSLSSYFLEKNQYCDALSIRPNLSETALI